MLALSWWKARERHTAADYRREGQQPAFFTSTGSQFGDLTGLSRVEVALENDDDDPSDVEIGRIALGPGRCERRLS